LNLNGRKDLKYFYVGAWNTFFGILTFFLLHRLFHMGGGYLVAITLSYAISMVQSHFTQRRFVWQSNSRYLSELIRFVCAYLAQYLLNLLGLYFCVELLHLDAFVAQLLLLLILTVSFFFVSRIFVFKLGEKNVNA
jgi:putative flippase GtrA